MTPNHVKHKLKAGTPAIGTWLNIGDSIAAEAVAELGFDWLVIDAEHGPIDRATMASMFAAIGRYPVAPMARLTEISEGAVKRVLDAGGWGFVAPNVKAREEAELIVAAAKYPPQGVRSLGWGRHSLSFRTDPQTYFEKANDEILIIAQIEHIDAIKKIDDILSVHGVDACYVGPNDLCASCGLAPSLEPSHREFEEMMQTVLAAARRHRIAAGLQCATPETVSRRIGEGWTLLGIGNDLRFLTASARAAREAIKI